MDLKLSDREYLVLIKSVHTRDVTCIAHAVLKVEKILHTMRQILDSHGGLSITEHPPETQNMEDGYEAHSVHYVQENVEQYSSPIFDSSRSLPIKVTSERTSIKENSDAMDLSLRTSQNNNYEFQYIVDLSKHENLKKRKPGIISLDDSSQTYDRGEEIESSPLNLTTNRHLQLDVKAEVGDQCIIDQEQIISNQLCDDTTLTRERNADKRKSKMPNNRQSVHPFPSKRPMTCNLCSKVVRADNFQVHQRSHTGEKPYKCPKCPFRSANPSSMPKHLRLHDKAREIYKCHKCPYSTIYKSNLSAHRKTNHLNMMRVQTGINSLSSDGGSTHGPQCAVEDMQLTTTSVSTLPLHIKTWTHHSNADVS